MSPSVVSVQQVMLLAVKIYITVLIREVKFTLGTTNCVLFRGVAHIRGGLSLLEEEFMVKLLGPGTIVLIRGVLLIERSIIEGGHCICK